MKKKCIFLGGPIQNISNDNKEVYSEKKLLIQNIVDCLEKEEMQILSAHVTEAFGLLTPQVNHICRRDYSWMKQCDAFCVLLIPDEKGFIRSDGSCIELGWAYSLRKPIIVVTEPNQLYKFSALLQGMLIEAKVRIVSFSDIENNVQLLADVIMDAVEENSTK
ncbi:hypothetical protein FMM75_23255 [Lachnospiraceae bacterium MD335]|nr:hypothetical protein [Lachnospiraceae bacterium MD335]